MKRKKILITIDWYLPGTKSGGPVRSYANMINHLGKYHDFYIITRDSDYCSDSVYAGIQSDTWNQLDAHTSVYYFSKENLNRKNVKALLKSTQHDILYVNGIYSWFFSILPVIVSDRNSKIIVAARGMLNPQAFSVKGFKKKVFLLFANAMSLYKNVEFHATNADEGIQIARYIKNFRQIKIAPNLPRPLKMERFKDCSLHNPVKIINIGRVSIEKGTLKMIQAFQGIKACVSLDIYGPIYDEEYWMKCKKAIEALPKNVTVTYKGVVDGSQVLNLLADYDYFMLLSEGENFGHAILEALSVGLPVIISNQTPWQDLETKQIGWDVDINNKEDLKHLLENVTAMNVEDYDKMSKNAFKFALDFSENPELIIQNRNLFL